MSRLSEWAERRSGGLNVPSVPLSSQNILQWLGGGKTRAGIAVTPTSALSMIAVYRSVALLAGAVAGLPLKTYRHKDRVETHLPLLVNPHPDLTSFELWELATAHIAMWGNAYFAKVRDRGTGAIVQLQPILPDRVEVTRDPTAVSGTNPSGKLFAVNNSARVQGAVQAQSPGDRSFLGPAEVLHIPGFGYDGLVGLGPIGMAREAVAAGLAAEEYANALWSNGALVGGFLKVPGKIDRQRANDLKAAWKEKVTGLDAAHDVAVLDAGAEFQQLSIPPQDAQFIETRRFQVAEIARLFGIPPHLLGETDRTTSWGTGIEKQTIGFVSYTLKPGYLQRVEARATKELTPRGQFAEFVVAGLLRGDHASRAAYYKTMTDIGALTVDEVRALENLPELAEPSNDDEE